MVGHSVKFSSSIVTTVGAWRSWVYKNLGGQIFALLVLHFLATFEILLSGLGTTRKYHKSFSCNFWGVDLSFFISLPYYRLLTRPHGRFKCPNSLLKREFPIFCVVIVFFLVLQESTDTASVCLFIINIAKMLNVQY